jgi:hypothetical protein
MRTVRSAALDDKSKIVKEMERDATAKRSFHHCSERVRCSYIFDADAAVKIPCSCTRAIYSEIYLLFALVQLYVGQFASPPLRHLR